MLSIENGIPIPPRKGGAKSELMDTLRNLEVAQSFAIPAKPTSNVKNYIYHLRPKRFTTRNLIENEVQVIRVWRTE